jgi:apolipoprotein N-acyltransferase
MLGYGEFRLLTAPPAPHTALVGLAASDLSQNMFPQDDRDVIRLMRGYANQVQLLSRRGAQIVVLPEMTALVRDTVSGEVNDLFEKTARLGTVQIVLGVLHVTSHAAFNEARLYLPSGTLAAVYCKRHLVPVLEGRTTPVKNISFRHEPAGTIGLAICRDMDYPDPAADYGKAGVGLLLVPAWDFGPDRLWHGHMAIMRGIENGFTIVRVAKNGLLTVSDGRGRVLSEMPTTSREPFTTLLATVPVRHVGTLYQSWGDWFAWLDIAFVAALLIIAAARRQKDVRAVPQIDSKNGVASSSESH